MVDNTVDNIVLILDFGSQYTQLITRRVRELGVYCEVKPYFANKPENKPCAIILSGGPNSILEKGAPLIPDWVFNYDIPILGLCYGMQTLCKQLGGEVSRSGQKEYGNAKIMIKEKCTLFENLNQMTVWMSHQDMVTKVPDGFEIVATTEKGVVAAVRSKDEPWYGIQFHPEVSHTTEGLKLLDNFLKISGCLRGWTIGCIVEQAVNQIREQILPNNRVLIAVSGGVDSSVVAALCHKAVPNNMVPVFVDNGLLRLGEKEEVVNNFKKMGINLNVIEGADTFLGRLEGVVDPEKKRKIIGNTFIELFEDFAHSYPKNITHLAQGTIYPDVIESSGVGSTAHTIKSHHNVGGLPDVLQLKLLEPIRMLFKDEVRKIGSVLLPENCLINMRHPFPGPGLGIRIMGEVSRERLKTVAHADKIFTDELFKANLYHDVSQAFAVLLPVKTVGIKGDRRCYEEVICLRAVCTDDFMTAKWAQLPYKFFQNVSTRIVSEVDGITRVVYDITEKPPGTVEWE